MKVGDKVELIRTQQVGIIKYMGYINKPNESTMTASGVKTGPPKECFKCETDDGTTFLAWGDELRLLE